MIRTEIIPKADRPSALQASARGGNATAQDERGNMPLHARSATCAMALVDAMAETMREMAFAGESVTEETLAQRGYSQAAIKRLGKRAAALARRRSIRRVER